jgi:hypothetical protein
MIDPIDAQMEVTVQKTRHNAIKTHWDIIAESHKIVDMSLYALCTLLQLSKSW